MLMLVACAGGQEDDNRANDDGLEGEKGGDLVIATAADAVSLDPNGSNDTSSLDVQRY